MAKPKRRKATLRSAGRAQEADILETARALAEDPTLAMPQCEHGCVWFSPVAAANRGILKAHAARDDGEALLKLARRGNELAKAYAATILVARDGKVPVVADLRLPGNNVPYTMRGTAKPFYLAGLQHHDDRALRLLAVSPWVKKRRMHFYSADRGIVCTGGKARPPRDFVEEEAALLELHAEGPNKFVCEHSGAGPDRPAVRIRWKSAGVELVRCASCAGDANTLRGLLRHIAARRAAEDFDPSAVLAPLESAVGEAPDLLVEPSAAAVRDYRAGTLSDRAFLETAVAARIAALRSHAGRLYVAGNVSYGEDAAKFIDALSPTDAERRALEAGLAAHAGPVIIDRATSARAIADLWPTVGRAMLVASARDEGTADALFKERATPEEAVEAVRRAAREGAARSVLSRLPRYRGLPPAAAVADAVVRALRAEGQAAATRAALDRASGERARGVALALLNHLGAAKGQEWRFTDADRDVASSVKDAIPRLIAAEGTDYHACLSDVSMRAGETDRFAPI